MKKMTIVRFKPKPEYYDQFVQDIVEHNQHGGDAHVHEARVMTAGEEVVVMVIRDAEKLAQSASEGVAWLDTKRHMLQEYNAEDRHTLPMTGDLVE
ncbi:MAG: hypothetical protein J4F41_07540 [Alphaproteobacteria bacterium]|nr:hypothetical protein [Alphaproteobacteria bacterium]